MSYQYPAYSYEDTVVDVTVAEAAQDSLKICDACGKLFLPTGRNAWRMRFCQRKHYIKCKICGDILDITPNKNIPSTCSKSCGDAYKGQQTKATMIRRYGVANPSQVPEFKEKAKASNAQHKEATMQKIHDTMIKRYGAPIPRQVPMFRDKIDRTMQARYGVINPSHSQAIRDKISQSNRSEKTKNKYKATSLAHYGTEYPAQNPDAPNAWKNIKDNFESTMLTRYGVTSSFAHPASREKAKNTCLIRYGYTSPSQSPEVHRKQWHNRKNLRATDGTPLDSTYEVIVYDFWKSLGLEVKRNIPIDFEFDGKTHTTFIDFEVDGVLFEVKGRPYLEGVYDYKQVIPIAQKLDVYRRYDVVLISDSHAQELFVPNGQGYGLNCVDLSLFQDAQTDDKLSLWNMIKAHINAPVGFIDSQSLLSDQST